MNGHDHPSIRLLKIPSFRHYPVHGSIDGYQYMPLPESITAVTIQTMDSKILSSGIHRLMRASHTKYQI